MPMIIVNLLFSFSLDAKEAPASSVKDTDASIITMYLYSFGDLFLRSCHIVLGAQIENCRAFTAWNSTIIVTYI